MTLNLHTSIDLDTHPVTLTLLAPSDLHLNFTHRVKFDELRKTIVHHMTRSKELIPSPLRGIHRTGIHQEVFALQGPPRAPAGVKRPPSAAVGHRIAPDAVADANEERSDWLVGQQGLGLLTADQACVDIELDGLWIMRTITFLRRGSYVK